METETVTALATIEQLTPMQLFAPGALDPILERIRAEARAAAAELDISTDEGRKAIASLAYKVARTKTFLDERRVELVAERKKEVAAIDGEGRRFRDAMDALKEEVRAPLTEWEDADKSRIAANESRILKMTEFCSFQYPNLASVEQGVIDLDRLFDHGFQEFSKRASAAREKAAIHLQFEKNRILKHEADLAEEARLRAEAEEKARIDRENKIAEDARLKAEAEAKRREEAHALAAKQREDELARVAAEEKSRLEREKQAADERARKAEADRKKAEDDRVAADRKAQADSVAAAEKAEADRKAAFAKSEADRAAATEKAERDRLAAIEAERKRVEDARLAAEEETRKREADRAHRGKINREALAALKSNGVDELVAKTVIELVSRKLIAHVSITY